MKMAKRAREGLVLRAVPAYVALALLVRDQLRHVAYAGGWKKFEPMWNVVIRARQVLQLLPLLESVLTSFGRRPPRPADENS